MEIVSFVVLLTGEIVSRVVKAVASTKLCQCLIRKLDSLLWTLEKPARYCVDGKDMDLEVTSPVFWIVLSVIQICRVSVSKILTKFNRKPIKTEDIVKKLQKWRRALRSIRFEGLRGIKESEIYESNGNSCTLTSSPLHPQSNSTKKHNLRYKHDDSLDHDLLEELMNRTFSDSDDLDSTFTISRNDDASMNCSSIGQSFLDCLSQSTGDIHSSHNATLPIALESDTELQAEPARPKKMGFEFTDESAFMISREVSSSSWNGEIRKMSEPTCTESGKEPLNQPVDPADAVISQILRQKDVETNNGWNGKFNHINKKNSKSSNDIRFINTTKASHESVNRHQAMPKTKSHESIGNGK